MYNGSAQILAFSLRVWGCMGCFCCSFEYILKSALTHEAGNGVRTFFDFVCVYVSDQWKLTAGQSRGVLEMCLIYKYCHQLVPSRTFSSDSFEVNNSHRKWCFDDIFCFFSLFAGQIGCASRMQLQGLNRGRLKLMSCCAEHSLIQMWVLWLIGCWVISVQMLAVGIHVAQRGGGRDAAEQYQHTGQHYNQNEINILISDSKLLPASEKNPQKTPPLFREILWLVWGQTYHHHTHRTIQSGLTTYQGSKVGDILISFIFCVCLMQNCNVNCSISL